MKYQKKRNKRAQMQTSFHQRQKLHGNFSLSAKRAQMEISFGTIFSIILIIAFIVFAAFGIGKLVNTMQYAKIKSFQKELQGHIDSKFNGEYGAVRKEYYLPKKIEKVCFSDDSFENIYFMPFGEFKGGKLNHVDFSRTIPQNSETLCINVNEGKLVLYLRKNQGETLVTIVG
ncbi:MAG TPA: hypothetical protein PK357_00865 [Candidatus Pacearchaeota archaeon]|nr:hypothetical protein [Candidatus Pacearchaeota archaeon]